MVDTSVVDTSVQLFGQTLEHPILLGPGGPKQLLHPEGDEVTATLSDEFRVVFVLESVQESTGAIKLRSLALQRITLEEDGTESVRDLYRTGMVLHAGKLKVVGAAADPSSKRALFLTLQARAR